MNETNSCRIHAWTTGSCVKSQLHMHTHAHTYCTIIMCVCKYMYMYACIYIPLGRSGKQEVAVCRPFLGSGSH